MSNIKYGVTSYPHEDDDFDSTHVLLGDGMTAVQSIGMEDGFVGICFARDGEYSHPFETNEQAETHKFQGDKVFILANDKRSIDAVIARLEEAKEFL